MHESFSNNGHEKLLYFNGAISCLSVTITTYVTLISRTLVPVHDFAGVKSSVLKTVHKTDRLRNYIYKDPLQIDLGFC